MRVVTQDTNVKASIAALFEKTAVNRLLGLELLATSDEYAEVRLPVRDEIIQETGVVQGGILSSLADVAAVYALAHSLPKDKTIAGVEFKMNFLRPALPGGGDVLARGEIIRRGGTIGLCRVTLTQDGREVATGLFTYLAYSWAFFLKSTLSTSDLSFFNSFSSLCSIGSP